MQSQVERWSDLTTGLRVLVVDDDSLSLKVVGQLLKFCGFTGGGHTCFFPAQGLACCRFELGKFPLQLPVQAVPPRRWTS